jgi:hypothetical protein
MLCFLHEWNISRALDTGKPLSRLTERHLDGCASCREFSRLGREMERRLIGEAASIPGGPELEIGEKVRKAVTGLGPYPSSPGIRPGILSYRPALAAALLLAAMGVGLFWLARPRSAGLPPIAALIDLDARRAGLIGALKKAESPYDEELQGLKRAFLSTADFLAARFNTGLGPDSD